MQQKLRVLTVWRSPLPFLFSQIILTFFFQSVL